KAKLYIDFLDMYPLSYFEEIIGDRAYISSSEKERILYSNSNNTNDDIEYPMLIPGSHKITIEVNDKRYYMFLVVTALHIREQQLKTMRKEVDEYIEGLAKKTRGDLSISMEEY